MGKQHLGGVQIVLLKARLPSLHQPHLAHRSSGLQLVHGIRTRGPAQPGHSFRHGTRGHNHHFDALLTQRHHAVHPGLHQRTIQPLAVISQQGTTYLDYPTLAVRHTHSLVTLDQGS